MAKLLYVIICSLAVQCAAEMGRQRRWRMERRKKAAAKAAAERREREKNAPRDAESTSDGTIANWRQRARAWGLNPPDEDNKTAANATTTPGAGAKDNYLRTYNVRPSAAETRLDKGGSREIVKEKPHSGAGLFYRLREKKLQTRVKSLRNV